MNNERGELTSKELAIIGAVGKGTAWGLEDGTV